MTTDADDFLKGDTSKTKTIPSIDPTKTRGQAQKEKLSQSRLNKTLAAAKSLNISPSMLPPLTRRRSAVYELLNMKREDPRVVEGPRMIEIPPMQYVPTYLIYDRYETDLAKSTKTLVFSNKINVNEYYNTAASISDKKVVPNIDMPEFINGQASVDCEAEYLKYIWWELHPLNSSNKYRDKTKQAQFKRVDVEYASPHLQLMQMDLRIDAEMYVKNLNADKLIQLGAAFGLPANISIQDLRLDLRMKAQADPKQVLFKSPEKHATALRNIVSAMTLGILDYKPETQEFYFDEDAAFYQVALDGPPLESLAKYLITDEAAPYKEQLETSLSFWD